MVGSVRSALMLVAACASVPGVPTAKHARRAKPEASLPYEISNELVEIPPDRLPGLDDHPMVADVVVELGPPRDPPLTEEARRELQHQLPRLKGTARLIALDRLAAASDADLETSDADPTIANKAYEDAIAARGFAKYAHADAVLFRAAQVLLEHDRFASGADYVARLIASYPRSPWIPDAEILVAKNDRDSAEAMRYFDDAIAAGRPIVADYARYQKLSLLVWAGAFPEAIADAVELVHHNEIYRDPVALTALVAFTSLEPDEALARLADIDQPRLADMSVRLAESYRYVGKSQQSLEVLLEQAALATEPLARCQIALDILETAGLLDDKEQTMRAATELVRIAHAQPDTRCRANAESWLAMRAWTESTETKPYTPERREVDAFWLLTISVSTNADHKALELRNHAYLSWELATLSHTAAGWWTAAHAFDEAFLVAKDPQAQSLLSAGANAARELARHAK
jgi:hypothetical protein